MHPQDVVAAIGQVVGRRAENGDINPDLAVYLHIPFCTSKCHFCDWVVDVPVSRLRSDETARDPYIAALMRQIRFYGPLLTEMGYRPKVMYWGGGTPTRLSPEEIRSVGRALDESFDFASLRQWSAETTPNNLDAERLEALQSLGVDRVSVGAQSFDAYQLRRSGRAHSAEQVEQSVAILRAAGLENFNIDLISSFPGEAEDAFRTSLERTLALDPPHISVYPYRATQKTVMAMQLERSDIAAQTRSRMIAAYELAMEMLQSAGYHEYCHGYWVRRPEDEDQDGNYKYDLEGDKFGFGSGAESIIGHHLLWNENAKYAEYLGQPESFTLARKFSVDQPERLTALIGGALMTREGVDYARFLRLTGIPFADVRSTPYVSAWLDVLEECGALFVETETALRMDPAVIHVAYISHLAYTMSAGLTTARA